MSWLYNDGAAIFDGVSGIIAGDLNARELFESDMLLFGGYVKVGTQSLVIDWIVKSSIDRLAWRD